MLRNIIRVLLFSLLVPPVAAMSLDSAADFIGNKLARDGLKRAAVLGFNFSGDKKFRELVQERLINALVNQGKIEVMDRSHTNALLKEKQLEQSGAMDEKTSSEIGKLLKVNAIISGTITELTPTALEINIRAIDANTGKIHSAVAASMEKTADSGIAVRNDPKPSGKPSVQIALLLDTSSSMDGLINQARTQMWKIVNELATAEKDGKNPAIEVAIYEYGNDSLPAGEGYLRQAIAFSSDLDKVSKTLFSLTTNGGEEYAGKVILDAVNNLQWKNYSDVYRVIFIAGNEPFSQGPVNYRDSIAKARAKGITVNTVFCGMKQQGAGTGWLDGAIAGGGDYLAIEQNMQIVRIEAPQDARIEQLGRTINDTFVPYGQEGEEAQELQMQEDKNADDNRSSGASINRYAFKAKKQYSQGNSWDLVSRYEQGKLKVKDLDKKNLPKNLQGKSPQEIEKYLKDKAAERKKIQDEIARLDAERKKYVAEEEKKKSSSDKNSLDKAMMNSIRNQAEAADFEFK